MAGWIACAGNISRMMWRSYILQKTLEGGIVTNGCGALSSEFVYRMK